MKKNFQSSRRILSKNILSILLILLAAWPQFLVLSNHLLRIFRHDSHVITDFFQHWQNRVPAQRMIRSVGDLQDLHPRGQMLEGQGQPGQVVGHLADLEVEQRGVHVVPGVEDLVPLDDDEADLHGLLPLGLVEMTLEHVLQEVEVELVAGVEHVATLLHEVVGQLHRLRVSALVPEALFDDLLLELAKPPRLLLCHFSAAFPASLVALDRYGAVAVRTLGAIELELLLTLFVVSLTSITVTGEVILFPELLASNLGLVQQVGVRDPEVADVRDRFEVGVGDPDLQPEAVEDDGCVGDAGGVEDGRGQVEADADTLVVLVHHVEGVDEHAAVDLEELVLLREADGEAILEDAVVGLEGLDARRVADDLGGVREEVEEAPFPAVEGDVDLSLTLALGKRFISYSVLLMANNVGLDP